VSLADAYEDFRSTRWPAPFPDGFSDDAFSRMFQEDGDLAGLVMTFLDGGQVALGLALGRTRATSIELDMRIDDALADAVQLSPELRLDEVLRYRRKMLDLAHSLSHASGVPIRHVPRD
jgi:hypothetical protein